MMKYAWMGAVALALTLATGSALAGGKGGIFGDCGKHSESLTTGSTADIDELPEAMPLGR